MRRLGRRRRGLTLVEVAVAVLVLSLGTVAALRVTDQGRVAIAGDLPRVLVATAARNRAEALLLHGPAMVLPGSVIMGGSDIRLDTSVARTAEGLVRAEIQARAATGEAASAVVFLPGITR